MLNWKGTYHSTKLKDAVHKVEVGGAQGVLAGVHLILGRAQSGNAICKTYGQPRLFLPFLVCLRLGGSRHTLEFASGAAGLLV